jgi:3-isopropylmalate dehydrogenase
MMLRYTFAQESAPCVSRMRSGKCWQQGYRTADIYEPGTQKVGTRAMGDAVLAAL